MWKADSGNDTIQGPEESEGLPLALFKFKLSSRNLPDSFIDSGASVDEIDKALQQLSRARLDREGITVLHPTLFTCVPHLSSLYLQQNELKSLSGIEAAKQLQFLTVAGNKLTAIEGLKGLLRLRFLDVSGNSVDQISVESQLPLGLSFLNVYENPCCEKQDGLVDDLIRGLPKLKELDGNWVSAEQALSEDQPGPDLDIEHQCLPAHGTMLQELAWKTSDDPLRNEGSENSEQALNRDIDNTEKKVTELLHSNFASSANAVQSIFESRAQLLRRNFEAILQRSRARHLQDEEDAKERSDPARMYRSGEVRAKLQDFFAASAVARELGHLDEKTIARQCLL